MEFEIDFNTEEDDDTLEAIGAKVSIVNGDYLVYRRMIKLNKFEELEVLVNKVAAIKGNYYSPIVGFDPPTIFLDNNV